MIKKIRAITPFLISHRFLFLLFSRLFVGGLFFYSGFSKLIRPIEYFQIAIGMYDIVSPNYVVLIASSLPWLELCLGAFLILGYFVSGSAWILVVISGCFQFTLAQALIRGLAIIDAEAEHAVVAAALKSGGNEPR